MMATEYSWKEDVWCGCGFPCSKTPEVDPVTLSCVTDTIQSHERLCLQLRRSSLHFSQQVLDQSREALDTLQAIKSEVEGSHLDYVPTKLNEAPLQELRQLTLMHVPSSVTEDVKQKFQALVLETLKGKCQKVVCAVLLTCPWYMATQKERGEQARHNIVIVVYINFDDQFITPANQHVQDQGNVTDLGWLHVVELAHFGHFLSKGRTRFVEALYCNKRALLYATDEWLKLREDLKISKIMGVRGFIEACRGQALSVTKKRKNGGLKLKDATTFYQLCETFRLLLHADNTIKGIPVCTDLDNIPSLTNVAQVAISKLKALYEDLDVSKQDIFRLIVLWKDDVNTQLQGFAFTNLQDVEAVIGCWMSRTRLQGRQLLPLQYLADEHSNLVRLQEDIGGPVCKMQPEQILLIAQAGSFMYGLSTPDSDVDYIVIYAEPARKIFSTCRRLVESVENRGPTKKFEYGAYEARLFSEMVLKGSVVILELLFADGHTYMSSSWQALIQHRDKFLTERGIQQYMGLIKNNFSMIQSEKHAGTSRDRKLFYQIFHKLDSLEYFAKGVPPPVRCEGEVRNFIMRVRKEPLEGELERENIYQLAQQKYDDLRIRLANRQTRLPENADFGLMTAWLQAVRGIPCKNCSSSHESKADSDHLVFL